MPTILRALFMACIALPAVAQEPGSSARFDQLDRNGDGFISRDEAKDAEELNTRYSELDVNNDNKLSRQEYGTLEAERRAAAARSRSAATGGTGKSRHSKKGD